MKQLISEYESLCDSHGDEYARNYICTLCGVIIDDPTTAPLVREGISKILNSFLKNEHDRLQQQIFNSQRTDKDFGDN